MRDEIKKSSTGICLMKNETEYHEKCFKHTRAHLLKDIDDQRRAFFMEVMKNIPSNFISWKNVFCKVWSIS